MLLSKAGVLGETPALPLVYRFLPIGSLCVTSSFVPTNGSNVDAAPSDDQGESGEGGQ